MIQYYGKHALTPDGSEKLLFPCPQESSVAFPGPASPNVNGSSPSRLIKSTWLGEICLKNKKLSLSLQSFSSNRVVFSKEKAGSTTRPTLYSLLPRLPPPQTKTKSKKKKINIYINTYLLLTPNPSSPKQGCAAIYKYLYMIAICMLNKKMNSILTNFLSHVPVLPSGCILCKWSQSSL